MIYFANPTSELAVHEAMAAGVIAFIDTPAQGNKRPDGVVWCADNGCFGKGFSEAKWWRWLQNNDPEMCVFATAPDVVGDAEATLERSRPWLPKIRALGFPSAFVAQDGSDVFPPPWGEFDVLFIGGTDQFKLGPVARRLVAEAKTKGLWVHCGRVSSYKRFRAMEAIGCDSCDGTYLKYGPAKNLPNVLRWVRSIHESPALFGLEGA